VACCRGTLPKIISLGREGRGNYKEKRGKPAFLYSNILKNGEASRMEQNVLKPTRLLACCRTRKEEKNEKKSHQQLRGESIDIIGWGKEDKEGSIAQKGGEKKASGWAGCLPWASD